MTLEEYYKAKEKIKAPEGMDWFDKFDFYKTENDKLKKQLSPEALRIVKEREDRWEDKMQSSVG